MFEDFAAACEQELAFLVRDYGFEASEPEHHKYECTVTYHKPSGTVISVEYEVGVSPWFIVAYRPSGQKGKTVRKGLHQLARRKLKGWKAPELGDGDRRQEMHRVLASYGELLQHHFPELLEGRPPELPETGEATAASPKKKARSRKLSNRQAGFLRLMSGGVLFATIWTYVYSQGDLGESRGGIYSVVGMGAPGALAIVGLVELLTNRSFWEFSDRWDALPGWKRGVFGVIAVLAAAVAIFGPLLLFLWVRDG